ncbi:MAG: OmpA family protein [Acidobacteriia bacterium]|nr:OmpA family protein [Terriglobia bacterium]
MRRLGYFLALVVAVALGATAGFAQTGKLKVKVTPNHAYVFVDGKAIRDGNQTIALSPGKHTVVVVNYGYKISTQDVNVDAGKTTPLTVALEAYGGPVNGPFGQLQVKGDGHAAVLLNGKTPGYFVGHAKSTLLLAPGSYHVTATRAGNDLWSGDVTVAANKKLAVDTKKAGAQKTSDKKNLAKLTSQPRSKGTTVAVAGVTGNFSVAPTAINCGQTSTLTWQTSETVEASISGIGAVPLSGSQAVSPHATTTYDFTSAGPGGIVKGTGTVNVNTKVDASLSASPAELQYRKIGEKVITEGSSTLTWQTSNADAVSIAPTGKADASGSQTIKGEPADASQVPEGQPARKIDETKSFTLNASNVCGGSATQSASVHITGTVEPIPTVTLQSVFYPTDYPDQAHPQVGLVRSQQLALATLAGGFKKYLEYDPDAKLSVEAHADTRGSARHNQDLSERRVQRIKQYLVEQGIPADKVQTAAYGKDRPMDRATVKDLEASNPNTPTKARLRNAMADWLAYNRRADIVLLPSGKKSAQFFPHTADDSGIIWQMPKAPATKVQKAQ